MSRHTVDSKTYHLGTCPPTRGREDIFFELPTFKCVFRNYGATRRCKTSPADSQLLLHCFHLSSFIHGVLQLVSAASPTPWKLSKSCLKGSIQTSQKSQVHSHLQALRTVFEELRDAMSQPLPPGLPAVSVALVTATAANHVVAATAATLMASTSTGISRCTIPSSSYFLLCLSCISLCFLFSLIPLVSS